MHTNWQDDHDQSQKWMIAQNRPRWARSIEKGNDHWTRLMYQLHLLLGASRRIDRSLLKNCDVITPYSMQGCNDARLRQSWADPLAEVNTDYNLRVSRPPSWLWGEGESRQFGARERLVRSITKKHVYLSSLCQAKKTPPFNRNTLTIIWGRAKWETCVLLCSNIGEVGLLLLDCR